MCREHEPALKTPHLPSNPSQPCLVSKIYCVASLPHQGHLPTAEVADQPQGQEFFYLRWCRPMGSHGQTKAKKGGTREAERGAMNLLEHEKISCASFDWMSNQFRLYMYCIISIAVWSCETGLHIDLITIFCGHAALGFLGFPDLQGLQPNTSHSHATATPRAEGPYWYINVPASPKPCRFMSPRPHSAASWMKSEAMARAAEWQEGFRMVQKGCWLMVNLYPEMNSTSDRAHLHLIKVRLSQGAAESDANQSERSLPKPFWLSYTTWVWSDGCLKSHLNLSQ